jgi:hypothetical protein
MSSESFKWSLGDAQRRGLIALRLAERYRGAIEGRLSSGCIDHLRADLGVLDGGTGTSTLGAQKIATASKDDVAHDLLDLIGVVRDNVTHTRGLPNERELKTLLGVGDHVVVTDLEKLATIGEAIAARRATLAAGGVTPDEADEAAALALALRGKSTAQAGAAGTRGGDTDARRDAHHRAEAAIDEISTRGAAAHRKSPDARGRFERLRSESGPTAADEAEAKPATPAA